MNSQGNNNEFASVPVRTIIGVWLFGLFALLIGILFLFWSSEPSYFQTTINAEGAIEVVPVKGGGIFQYSGGFHVRLLALMMTLGALGGTLRAIKSYVDHSGACTLKTSYWQWYVFQSLIGALLAVPFLMLIGGGYVFISDNSNDINLYFTGTIVFSAGLFADDSINWLGSKFKGWLNDGKPDRLVTILESKQSNKVSTSKIYTISPPSVSHGSENLNIEINGEGFSETSRILVAGREVAPQFVSAEKLLLVLDKTELDVVVSFDIIVANQDGSISDPAIFKVT